MGEEFLLKWNDYQASFASMMESLCLTEEMVDCTISAGTKSFSAHRMILSTCSPYFRSLFASVPRHQHPVIVIRDMEDGIMELLVRYMYSGQVSVTEDQLVPLVQAAKSLSIKGLLDVPVQEKCETEPKPQTSSPKPPPAKKPKLKPEQTNVNPEMPKLHLLSEAPGAQSNPAPPTRIGEVDIYPSEIEVSKEQVKNGPNAFSIVEYEGDNSFDELDGSIEEGVDPSSSEMDQSQLLRRLTSEMTAFPFSGGGAEPPEPPPIQIYSCEHCGKEFTSKRKHQRHVLNVHFGYNPVQCPFCNKGHRDNYNLKQHVCPVLNMKYGVFEKKEVEAGGSMGHSIGATNLVGSGSNQELLLKNALAIASSKNSDS